MCSEALSDWTVEGVQFKIKYGTTQYIPEIYSPGQQCFSVPSGFIWLLVFACYYMASSVSGQDESNPALLLATQAGKMELSCPLGTTRRVPQEKFPRKPYNKSFIDQACSVKMAGYWPRSFFASLWTETESRSINTQKKNLVNIQPSWPHTWSITHTYCL